MVKLLAPVNPVSGAPNLSALAALLRSWPTRVPAGRAVPLPAPEARPLDQRRMETWTRES
jgi:hypothetical protein